MNHLGLEKLNSLNWFFYVSELFTLKYIYCTKLHQRHSTECLMIFCEAHFNQLTVLYILSVCVPLVSCDAFDYNINCANPNKQIGQVIIYDLSNMINFSICLPFFLRVATLILLLKHQVAIVIVVENQNYKFGICPNYQNSSLLDVSLFIKADIIQNDYCDCNQVLC